MTNSDDASFWTRPVIDADTRDAYLAMLRRHAEHQDQDDLFGDAISSRLAYRTTLRRRRNRLGQITQQGRLFNLVQGGRRSMAVDGTTTDGASGTPSTVG